MAYMRLGDLLIAAGAITQEQLEEALTIQKQKKERLGDVLIESNIITERQLIEALQMQLGVDFIDLTAISIPLELAKFVPRAIAKKYNVVPVKLVKDELFVAMSDPLNFVAQEEIKAASHKRVVPMISTRRATEQAIGTLYGSEGTARAIEEMKREVGTSTPDIVPVQMNQTDAGNASAAPTIRFVNSVIERAFLERASDIHLEPQEGEMVVRMRIDGILRKILTVPANLQSNVISRLKIMGGMNISERKIPQDGRAMVQVRHHEIDLRISSMPTIYGEKIVLRLLDKSGHTITKQSIGLEGTDLQKYDALLKNSSGVILIVGPTGSGKSTILKIITGVLTPTQGEVKVDGRISALLELGAGFNMEYSGLENVYLNGTMTGFSKEEIDARLDDILEFADIGDFIHQPVKTYSSGMFVRLAFAVAINIDPEILVVDEALSVGDVFFQAKCYHKFEEFKKQGKTILFVSHDLSSVSKYCDRVILLNKGVKLDEGSPKQMVDLYKQLLVGQDPVKQQEADKEKKAAVQSEGTGNFQANPNMLEYGNRMAEIIHFEVLDDRGMLSNTIEKGTEFKIRMKVHFNEDIQEPIMAYTFKNIKGTEITGTNTMFEKAQVARSGAGDECTVTFTQNMDLQGGEYLLSFGCTGYKDGDFTVFHRLYDACNITVVSSKNTVGFYDMNSRIEIQCEE